MDGKKNPSNLKSSDMDEIRAAMGGRMDRAELAGTNPHNPQKANMPKRPQAPGGIPPIVPLVPDDKVAEYEKWTRDNPERQVAFGNEQHGKLDQELNEIALRDIAAERGITVEELLAQDPDKRLEHKMEFADMNEKNMTVEEAKRMTQTPVMQDADEIVSELEAEESEEELELKLQEIELRKKLAQKKKASGTQAKTSTPKKAQTVRKASKKKAAPAKVHPLLKKLRQEFAIDQIKTADVVINGIKFSLAPPPGALQTWSMEKMAAAGQVSSEQAVIATIRNVVVATSLVLIEDTSIAEVFGLTTVKVENPLRVTGDLRILMAQTVWEMIHGQSTIEGLFDLDPEVVLLMYNGYDRQFGKSRYHLTGSESLHRYVCPVPDCEEMYEQPEPVDGNLFCKKHAVPMEDQGLVSELDQLPLS